MKTILANNALALGTAVAAAFGLGGCNSHTNTPLAAAAPTAAPGQTAAPDQTPASPDTATGFAPDPHACTIVTEQEAMAALGNDPGAGAESYTAGVGNCVYGARSSVVRVSIDPTYGKAVYEGDLSSLKSANSAVVVDVPGVGDAAVVTPSGASQATVYFYKAKAFLEITVGVETGEPPKDKAVALATNVAGRM